MVLEALIVTLGKIPPPRAELGAKALAELKRAMVDYKRDQLREISQRLSQVKTKLFSEGIGKEGECFLPRLLSRTNLSRQEVRVEGSSPRPTPTGGGAERGVAKARNLASRYARARKWAESNALAARGNRNRARLPKAPSRVSPVSSRDSLGLKNASRIQSLVSSRRIKRQRCGSELKHEILCP